MCFDDKTQHELVKERHCDAKRQRAEGASVQPAVLSRAATAGGGTCSAEPERLGLQPRILIARHHGRWRARERVWGEGMRADSGANSEFWRKQHVQRRSRASAWPVQFPGSAWALQTWGSLCSRGSRSEAATDPGGSRTRILSVRKRRVRLRPLRHQGRWPGLRCLTPWRMIRFFRRPDSRAGQPVLLLSSQPLSPLPSSQPLAPAPPPTKPIPRTRQVIQVLPGGVLACGSDPRADGHAAAY